MTTTVEETRRRPSMAVTVAGVVGVAMLALVAVLATRPSASDIVAESPVLGRPAPEIAGTTIDGDPVRLSTMRGRYVLVNFFASWCVPCQSEHPELVAFTDRYTSTGDATVLMVMFDDQPRAARAFFAKRGGPPPWPVVDDPSGRIALDYGVFGPPESFLVDRDGFVVSKIVGEVTARGLDRLIREAERRG